MVLITILKNQIIPFSKNFADIPEAPFKHVIGSHGAKEDLQEIVEFLKTPKKFEKFGGSFPRGVLISGPPGTFLFLRMHRFRNLQSGFV